MASLCRVPSTAVDECATRRRAPADPSTDPSASRNRLSSSSLPAAAPQKPSAAVPKIGAYSSLYLSNLHEWSLLASGQHHPSQNGTSSPHATRRKALLFDLSENGWWQRPPSPPVASDSTAPLLSDSEASMRHFISANFWEQQRRGGNGLHLDEFVRRCRGAKPLCDLLPQMLECSSFVDSVFPTAAEEAAPCGTALPPGADSLVRNTTAADGAPQQERTTIAGPSLSRRSAGWHSMLLDEDEDEGSVLPSTPLIRGQTTTTTAASNAEPPKRHEAAAADGANTAAAMATSAGEVVELFLLDELKKWWEVDHHSSVSMDAGCPLSSALEVEAQKSKTLPALVGEALEYLASLVKIRMRAESVLTSTSPVTPAAPSPSLLLPLPQRYPPPRFSGSPFANETNRFTKWLRTWRSCHHDNWLDTIEDEEEEQAPAKRRKTKKDSGGNAQPAAAAAASTAAATAPNGTDAPKQRTKSAAGRDEFRDGVAAIIETGSFIVDDRGNRLSARIARKEALQRLKDEMEERERQKQRGYFSNDTSDLTRVSIAGGEGAMSNVAVLSGPTGVGKTAAVYAAAQAMGYRVVEINTSLKRTAKSIEKAVAEATQSKQIHVSVGSSDAGRLELERLAAAAEAKRRANAKEAEHQRRLQAEARERDAVRHADEYKQGQEASAAAARAAARKAAGIKKENGISQAAVSSFFRVKRPAPATTTEAAEPAAGAPVVEVVDVEAECHRGALPSATGALRNAVAVVDVDGEDESRAGSRPSAADAKRLAERRVESSLLPPPTSAAASSVCREIVDADEPQRLPKRKRDGATDVPEADYTALPTSIVVVDDVGVMPSSTTQGTSPVQKDAALLPLILIESADVIMDDEVQKSIYATIRSLGAETKFPIIVTGNQVGSQLVHHTFGAGTPHAVMSAAPAMYVLLQGLLVAMAERGIATPDATQRHGIQFVGDAATLSEQLRCASAVVDKVWRMVDGKCDIRRFLFALQVELCAPPPGLSAMDVPPSPTAGHACIFSWMRDVGLCAVAERTMQLELDAQAAPAAAIAERDLHDSDSDDGDDSSSVESPWACSSSAVSDAVDGGEWFERLSRTPHAILKKQSLHRIVALQYRSRNASLKAQCMKSQLALSEIANLLPKILPKPKRASTELVDSVV